MRTIEPLPIKQTVRAIHYSHVSPNETYYFLKAYIGINNPILAFLEAEYAFALKKRIVPLKLQSGYEPREWLTSVIGSKFYLTFTADSSFEKQINDLKTHIVSTFIYIYIHI